MFSERSIEDKMEIAIADLESDQHTESILFFLEKYLPAFVEEIKLLENERENSINSQLSLFLNSCVLSENSFRFLFDRESPDSKSPEDITVNKKTGQRFLKIFVIECKRLPAPPPSHREQEYVAGKGAGIQRFKELQQGKHFSTAAMVGYVEKENFSYWFKQMNFWIEELTKQPENILWSKKDKLQKEYEREKVAKYKSENSRTNGTNIHLIHFWILKTVDKTKNTKK